MDISVSKFSGRLQKENIQVLKSQLTTMQQAVSASRAEVERCRTALSRYEAEENNLKIAAQRLDNQVEEITHALEKDNVEDGRMEALKRTLEEAREEEKVSSNSLEESEEAMRAIMNKLRETRRQLNDKDRSIKAQEEQVTIAENERSNVEQQRQTALANKNAAYSQIEEFNQEKTQQQRHKDVVVKIIQDYTEQASMVSPRIPVDEGETTDSLDRKLEKLSNDLTRFERQLVSSARLLI